MPGRLDDDDRRYLRLAVELSRGYEADHRRWPFGAVLVADGTIIGQGLNRVAELCDPTAHAEIVALRAASRTQGRHTFDSSVLYSSGEPCPMCLAACYWASIPRVVFAATSADLAGCGFQDLTVYDELGLPAGQRSMREDAGDDDLRQAALLAVQGWAERR
ncbi:MAG TPA: nucleoside deaminase [Trebonia sp.]|nr:nucleoside deaminase [Trebonia sp.]